MSEFFPVDDNNEEEDVDMKEDSDENGPEEKQGAEEMEGQSQEADAVNTTTVPSPASQEGVEVCKEQDSAKDENITKDNEITDHSVCDHEHPSGQENDSTKNEIKIETESQSSCMETEELSSNQEEATVVEQPEVIPLTDDQEEKGEKAQDEDTPRVAVKSEASGDTDNVTGPEVEMSSQVDSGNDPTECQPED
ncbi:ADP-ribose glycohydrolase MACROD2-like [Lepus europaeus]|uniref:ADP-ribose glycohydrolase MACROD2-like n=1 Tax=Lepus europaeus TaxID=9983 RepID=UPI002B4958EB|nr:ADP-ribose glycohydrolase MACROD2-like [Lepus europaeus]